MSTPNILPKLAIFIPASAVGGAEHYVKNILYLVEKIGFQPTLILPKNDIVVNFFAELKVDYLISDIAWIGGAEDLKVDSVYLNKLSRQYRETIDALQAVKPDCVFINLPWVDFGLGISLACHNLQIPCINLVHLCPWKVKLNSLTKQLFQELATTSSSFFTVSNDNRIQLSLSTGIDLDLIRVFYNSRDINSEYTSLTPREYRLQRLELLDELELPLNSFLSLCVGRFSHQKNFLDIITAFASVHHRLPNYYHIFLGEGELKKYYQKIVFDLGLSEKVKFLGYRKDVHRFLALGDVFISTSLYEGLALSLLESAQFLCPIIATNSSSAKEIIPDSSHGLLYNPGQYYLLGKYIEFAYYYPDKMKLKAKKLKSFCQQKFSLSQFKTNLETILQDAVDKESQPNKLSISYDRETKKLKPNTIKLDTYKYRGLPSEIVKTPISSFSLDDYASKILAENHLKYLHCLRKIARKFLYTKAILCFGAFDNNFFRSYYLKEQYLLFLISLEQNKSVTVALYNINSTYWGQDLEPDCIAKFTSIQKVTDISTIANINSNSEKYSHLYTSMSLLGSYLTQENNKLSNLSINLKTMDEVFKPSQYYFLEKDARTNKITMKLANKKAV